MPDPISVAIVGAGPAGFYTAQALLALEREVRIDILERLPTPYGLIRAGVAPDHQSTKKVSRKFERTLNQDAVRYFGNVHVGRDISIRDLQAAYDAVILAVGAPADRYLGIPGEDLPGVYGSALLVGWYNGHPDFHDLNPRLDTSSVVVIGNGNVALDVARVLVKTPDEMIHSDIADHAAAAIAASPITDVYVVGRRGPLDARFTNVELREMSELAACVPLVDADDLDGASPNAAENRARRIQEKNLSTLRAFSDRAPHERPKRVHFRFFASPCEILGQSAVEGVRFERTRVENGRAIGTGDMETIPAGLVVTAVGYRSEPFEGVAFDRSGSALINADGRVAPGLYVVGWAKRGPVGVISSNRRDGAACAAQVAADFKASGRPGRPALERMLADAHVRVITFSQWQKLDAAEVAAGSGQRPRRKITTLQEMLGVLDAPS